MTAGSFLCRATEVGKGGHGAWLGCASEKCRCPRDMPVLPPLFSPLLTAQAQWGASLDQELVIIPAMGLQGISGGKGVF